MKFSPFKNLLLDLLEFFGLAVWVIIRTTQPKCTYYFGPFVTKKEAAIEQSGYLEDLESEKAEGISVEIQRCQPKQLTILDEQPDENLPSNDGNLPIIWVSNAVVYLLGEVGRLS